MDKRVRKCFLRNVIILKFYFLFVTYILWLDFVCNWWIIKSFLDDKNVTESNFYLEKFCTNFGDCKCIKAQISPKKGISNACPKAGQYV